MTFRSRGAALFDGGRASPANRKRFRALGWIFLKRLQSARRVAVDRGGYRPDSRLTIGDGGIVVHPERFGPLRAFKRSPETGTWGRAAGR